MPSIAAGFMNMSFMRRHRLEQWVQSARADFPSRRPGDDHGGRSNAPHTARAAAPRPKWAGAPQRELPHAPAQDPTLADDPTLAEVRRPTPARPRWADMSEGEARVRLTYALRM